MSEGNGTASNFIWALAFVVAVALIVGALYYSGFLSNVSKQTDKKIDVKIEAPSAN